MRLTPLAALAFRNVLSPHRNPLAHAGRRCCTNADGRRDTQPGTHAHTLSYAPQPSLPLAPLLAVLGPSSPPSPPLPLLRSASLPGSLRSTSCLITANFIYNCGPVVVVEVTGLMAATRLNRDRRGLACGCLLEVTFAPSTSP